MIFFKSKNSFDKEYIKSLLLHYPDNFYLQWKNEQMEDVKIRIKHKLSIDLQTFKINMENKELIINVPEGYEIDKENSTFECIKFKERKEKPWRTHELDSLSKSNINCYARADTPDGYYIFEGRIFCEKYIHHKAQRGDFATIKQAKSALAMAQISQIMANDERFGGPITDKEWNNSTMKKHVIYRLNKSVIKKASTASSYCFLAFHTEEQSDLFLEENNDLVKDYLMID